MKCKCQLFETFRNKEHEMIKKIYSLAQQQGSMLPSIEQLHQHHNIQPATNEMNLQQTSYQTQPQTIHEMQMQQMVDQNVVYNVSLIQV